MSRYRATVQLADLEASDPAGVQRMVDERLRQSGFEHWRVVSIEGAGVRPPVRRPVSPRFVPRRRDRDPQAILIIAAAAWAFWLLWYLAG